MNKIKKKILIVFIIVTLFLIIFISLFTNIIGPPRFIYLGNYNGGKSGITKIENVQTIKLYESDNKKFILNKIRYCNNLKTIFICYNIGNFQFLDGVSIDELYVLSDCKDWASINNIKDIKKLFVIPINVNSKSTFNNCSVLQKFVSLEELSVNYDQEIDFTGLEKMTRLKTLEINSCQIDFGKIPIPDNLENLSICCRDRRDNEVDSFPNNIKELKNSNLKTLHFWRSYIRDISFIYDMTNFKTIEFLDCTFAGTETEINTVIDKLKDRNVEIIMQDNAFSS